MVVWLLEVKLPRVSVQPLRKLCSPVQSEQDDQAVVEASEVAQKTQEQGNKPQPDTTREAPPPPAEKGPKSKDGTLTEKEGRATGAAPIFSSCIQALIVLHPAVHMKQSLMWRLIILSACQMSLLCNGPLALWAWDAACTTAETFANETLVDVPHRRSHLAWGEDVEDAELG